MEQQIDLINLRALSKLPRVVLVYKMSLHVATVKRLIITHKVEPVNKVVFQNFKFLITGRPHIILLSVNASYKFKLLFAFPEITTRQLEKTDNNFFFPNAVCTVASINVNEKLDLTELHRREDEQCKFKIPSLLMLPHTSYYATTGEALRETQNNWSNTRIEIRLTMLLCAPYCTRYQTPNSAGPKRCARRISSTNCKYMYEMFNCLKITRRPFLPKNYTIFGLLT